MAVGKGSNPAPELGHGREELLPAAVQLLDGRRGQADEELQLEEPLLLHQHLLLQGERVAQRRLGAPVRALTTQVVDDQAGLEAANLAPEPTQAEQLRERHDVLGDPHLALETPQQRRQPSDRDSPGIGGNEQASPPPVPQPDQSGAHLGVGRRQPARKTGRSPVAPTISLLLEEVKPRPVADPARPGSQLTHPGRDHLASLLQADPGTPIDGSLLPRLRRPQPLQVPAEPGQGSLHLPAPDHDQVLLVLHQPSPDQLLAEVVVQPGQSLNWNLSTGRRTPIGAAGIWTG